MTEGKNFSEQTSCSFEKMFQQKHLAPIWCDSGELELGVTESTGVAEDDKVFETQVSGDDGTEYEVRMDGGHRFVVLPEIFPDGIISVTVKIYESDAQDAEPLLSPRILMQNGKEGVISIGEEVPLQVGDTDSSESQSESNPTGIRINVTPTLQR
jgi:type II secretory pathway component HofQ